MDDGVWAKVAEVALERRFIDHQFYKGGNQLCHSFLGKKAVVVFDNEDFLHHSFRKFDCHVPGCIKSFETLLEFEGHYNNNHKYVCGTCKKRLASPHLLDLHVSEQHDSYFAALAERKPMFQCYVEDCTVKSAAPKERRSHCIEVHKFPADFRYDCDKKQVKPEKNDDNTAVKDGPKAAGVAKFASFGHGVSRGFVRGRGQALHWHQRGRQAHTKAKENEVSMTDLEEALPVN